eukprot:gene15462-4645_t
MDTAESKKIETSEFLQNVEFVIIKKKLQGVHYVSSSDKKSLYKGIIKRESNNSKKDDLITFCLANRKKKWEAYESDSSQCESQDAELDSEDSDPKTYLTLQGTEAEGKKDN